MSDELQTMLDQATSARLRAKVRAIRDQVMSWTGAVVAGMPDDQVAATEEAIGRMCKVLNAEKLSLPNALAAQLVMVGYTCHQIEKLIDERTVDGEQYGDTKQPDVDRQGEHNEGS